MFSLAQIPLAHSGRISAVLALLLTLLSAPAQAASANEVRAADFEPAPVLDQSFFGFGGGYIAGYFNDITRHPLDNDFYGDSILGLGYQKFFATNPDGFSAGAEVGIGARFGVSAPSAEVWAGGVVRYDGIKLFDMLRVTPAVTVGFSFVTGKLRTEADRERSSGDSASVLFYLGPELDFSLVDQPEWEVFTRIQHRSGLYGTIANIDGANALTVGLRHRF